jgi:ABC-type branched-subunit amino acid transport system ATPase component/ABC-type branched-subunit amino acid transport system permease subunit
MSVAVFADAAREVRAGWRPRSTLSFAVFGVAALAPLVTGDARTADLASGLYLACAAVALAMVVGVAGLPLLSQGGFVAIGAVVGAHLLEHGVPTPLAAVAAAAVGGPVGAATGFAFARLPRAGFAAGTWILTWLIAIAVGSIDWLLGGSDGIVITGGPSPAGHYEVALALTALAALCFAALARSSFGLQLAAAREREQAAAALGVPVLRLRTTALAAAGAVAALTGALTVELAGVADASSFGPYLSFKLFVVVLIGGGLASLGAPAGVIVLAVLSVLADAVGALEHVAASRAHTLLASIMLLGVVSIGWEGLVRPARPRRAGGGVAPQRAAPRGLAADGLTKRYGELVAAAEVSLRAEPGTITALVGPNGSGKTTVLRMLSGAIEPDEGSLAAPDSVRTLQATAVFPSLSVHEHLLVGSAGRRRRGGFVRTLLATPQARVEDAGFVAEAEAIATRFGLPGDEAAGQLAAGDRRVLMLATAYATGAPVLLVDEPTAGASASEILRIAGLLRGLRAEGLALVVVEHNMQVVRDIADHVVLMDAGRIVRSGAPEIALS